MSNVIDGQSIAEAFENADKDIKVILTSDIVKDELVETLDQYEIGESVRDDFFREILIVVLGLNSKRDFLENIESIFQISTTKAQSIVQSVESIVFDRIKKVQEGLSSEYLNIDNNIDHFSNNSDYSVNIPEKLKKQLEKGHKLNYIDYEFIQAESEIM